MTKVMAREILEMWRKHSSFSSLSMAQVDTLLTIPDFSGKQNFSQADAIVIEMALVLAGIKFAE